MCQKPQARDHAVNVINESLFQAKLKSRYQVATRLVVMRLLPNILLVGLVILVDIFVPS